MKWKTLCNCLCSSSSCDSASPVRNIGASHIWDFGPCHNVKSHVCYDFLIPSENGFCHFIEKLKRQARVVLRKKLFVISCSAVEYLAWLKATPKLGRPILGGSIFVSLEVIEQQSEQKILANSGGVAGYTPA